MSRAERSTEIESRWAAGLRWVLLKSEGEGEVLRSTGLLQWW